MTDIKLTKSLLQSVTKSQAIGYIKDLEHDILKVNLLTLLVNYDLLGSHPNMVKKILTDEHGVSEKGIQFVLDFLSGKPDNAIELVTDNKLPIDKASSEVAQLITAILNLNKPICLNCNDLVTDWKWSLVGVKYDLCLFSATCRNCNPNKWVDTIEAVDDIINGTHKKPDFFIGINFGNPNTNVAINSPDNSNVGIRSTNPTPAITNHKHVTLVPHECFWTTFSSGFLKLK